MVEKRPRSLVSNSNEAKLRSWPEETITVAPIWGVPAASMTMPVIFPVFGAACSVEQQARAKQKSSAETAARYFRTFTGFYLPCGCGLSAARTVKFVVGVMVF